jgi:AcrR family transcriptional regulator
MNDVRCESSAKIRLLEVAILCFAEKGFDATGIREIAQKARANSALVHYYFGGKTGLYAEALRYIFSCRPINKVVNVPVSASHPNARAEATQMLRVIINNLLHELMTCNGDSTLDRASLLLVTRELQNPREDVAQLILDHMRPFYDNVWGCIKILRPDLDWLTAIDYIHSIIGQVTHLRNYITLIRLFRNDPAYPSDLAAVSHHITEFSLRGIGSSETLPGV